MVDPTGPDPDPSGRPAEQRILDATVAILARDGVAGVSARAVAREAGVATGLAGYYFDNKAALIGAALARIGEQDLDLVAGDDAVEPAEQLRRSLRRAVDPSMLDAGYLSLRLQLWSLAGVDPSYAAINRDAQQRYLRGLVDLVAAARPELQDLEIERRAVDVLVVQNGVWLTAVLLDVPAAVDRALDRCLELAFG